MIDQHLLLTCKFSDIPTLFPDHDFEELKRRRKALQDARAQRHYRKRNHVVSSREPGALDDRAWRAMCVRASRKYSEALARLIA